MLPKTNKKGVLCLAAVDNGRIAAATHSNRKANFLKAKTNESPALKKKRQSIEEAEVGQKMRLERWTTDLCNLLN